MYLKNKKSENSIHIILKQSQGHIKYIYTGTTCRTQEINDCDYLVKRDQKKTRIKSPVFFKP